MQDQAKASVTPEHRRYIKTDVPGVFKRGDRYVVITRHRGKRVKTFHKTKTEARKAKAARDLGKRPASTERFDRYARRWLDEYQGRTVRGLAPSTRSDYRYLITEYSIPYFGTMKLGDIGRTEVKAFIAHLSTMTVKKRTKAEDGKVTSARDKQSKKLSPATIRRIICPLRAMLNEAFEDELIATDAGNVRIVVRDRAGNRVDRKPIKTMTAEQSAAVLKEIPRDERLLFVFLAKTGVRISEALGAKWGDIEQTEDGVVFVISRQHYRGELREGAKTEAGERAVAIMPSLSRELMRHRASATYSSDTDPIFPTITGSHMDACNVRRRVLKPAATRAGVPWATPHVFRHSLARQLREQGEDENIIAAVLGHSDPNFTRKTYGRLGATEAVRFDGLDELLSIDVEEGTA
jgi:integrase